MKIRLYSQGRFFDTYYIYDESNIRIGIIEDHCHGVKIPYFVGWKMDAPYSSNTGETQTFSTIEEAMIYSVGEIITEQ